MCGNLNTHCFKSNSALGTSKVWGESDYYSDLKKEDKKQIKRSQPFQTVNLCQIQMYP